MVEIKVIGHVPADTDSTCSPIAYAWFLREIKGENVEAYIGGEITRETKFALNYFGVSTPKVLKRVEEGDKLIIVDTNNSKELVKGYEDAEIIEIVDHHKLAGLTTSKPTKVTMRPVACVATILWELMGDATEKLPREIAGLMLAAIISDTLNFTSPTTTDTDKDVAKKLANIANENIDELAEKMFAAKSDLSGMSTKEILLSDAKDYEFGGDTYKVGVLETTDPSQALQMEESLLAEMETIKTEEHLEGFMFFIVDILSSDSTMLISSDAERQIAVEAFGGQVEERRLSVPNVVSRKKQIVPALEGTINGSKS